MDHYYPASYTKLEATIMTPRERILTALEHREPDRVPVDFGGHRSSGIAAIAYRKLRAALGLPARAHLIAPGPLSLQGRSLCY